MSDSCGGTTESAEKDRMGSSSGSHEGSHEERIDSGDGELEGSKSSLDEGGGRTSFLFFEEDVLTVSCPGSSGVEFDYLGGCKVYSDSVASEGLMEQPHASDKETRGGLRQSCGDKGMKTQNAN